MDAAFGFPSEFRQCESFSPQSTSTVPRSFKSRPSSWTFKPSALNEECMPNKPIAKPTAAAKSGFPYEQTLAKVKRLVKEHQERPVSFTLSGKNYLRLQEDLKLDQSEKRYPSFFYDASTSNMIVQCMASPVHEGVVTIFADGFLNARSSLSARRRMDILPVTGEDFSQFHGSYRGSRKIADLAVKFRSHSGALEVKFVLEVGFSESYEQLAREARLWIDGTTSVSVCVLVDLQETPRYRCPTSHLSDADFERLGLPLATTPEMFHLPQNQYGPASFKGFNWTGVISTAQIEVWRKDALTGKASTDGRRMDILSSNPLLKFMASDFIALSPDENDCEINFDWEGCRVFMKDQIQCLAQQRYFSMLKERGKIWDGGDTDYMP